MVNILDVLQDVVPIQMLVDPLDDLLPPSTLTGIVLENGSINKELHGWKGIDA